MFPIGTCSLYHSIFQKVAENDRKLSVLYFHVPNLNQKKKFVFDSLFGGGNALLNVYCRAKSRVGVRGFGLGCICLGIKDSGGSRLGLGGLHCSVHFVSIFKSSLRRLSLRGTFRGFDTA